MHAHSSPAPPLKGILETALYVADLEQSSKFYDRLFGFPVMYRDHRLCALDAGPGQVVLLFLKGASIEATQTPRGTVPGHDGSGETHVAFAVDAEVLSAWTDRLAVHNIPIESTVHWPMGGISVYFRDPDGHLLELATPGLWENY
jgi:catechol 2,3-dioxygenase-like lactoylglutathione lyase family enzyme